MAAHAPTIARARPLSEGQGGIRREVAPAMQERIGGSFRDARVRLAAERIARGAPRYDEEAQAARLFSWVLACLEFRQDPTATELLQDPLLLLERIDREGRAAGDCDDHAMMIASLGHALGLPIVLVFCFFKVGAPNGHVYPALALADVVEDVERDTCALDTASLAPALGVHVEAAERWVLDALPEGV